MKKLTCKHPFKISEIRRNAIDDQIATVADAARWAVRKLHDIMEEMGVKIDWHETRKGRRYCRVIAKSDKMIGGDLAYLGLHKDKVIKRGSYPQCLEFMLMEWKKGKCYKPKKKAPKRIFR